VRVCHARITHCVDVAGDKVDTIAPNLFASEVDVGNKQTMKIVSRFVAPNAKLVLLANSGARVVCVHRWRVLSVCVHVHIRCQFPFEGREERRVGAVRRARRYACV
jgi:hypothetical protein